VENLPVAKVHGVGPATTAKMHRVGIATGLDRRAQTLSFLQQHFGKSGRTYYWIERSIDKRPVCADPGRKSVGAENTFAQDLHAFEPMREALEPIVAKVWRHCLATGIRGRTLTLKVKFANFQQVTRSKTVDSAIDSLADLERLSLGLLEPLLPTRKRVRHPHPTQPPRRQQTQQPLAQSRMDHPTRQFPTRPTQRPPHIKTPLSTPRRHPRPILKQAQALALPHPCLWQTHSYWFLRHGTGSGPCLRCLRPRT